LAQIFPKWTNIAPLFLAVGAVVAAISVVSFVWYYGSPKFTDVGYRPKQPVAYSHKLHAGDLGIDCRYCHVNVERAAVASIPPTQVCMNCHVLVKAKSNRLAKIQESWATGTPIKWVRVHNLPDFSYFDHSIHVDRGVGCITCHGNVTQMVEITQSEPLSMSCCLDCHRNPGENLRPPQKVTDMKWQKPDNQAELAANVIEEKKIAPPTDCSGCHR